MINSVIHQATQLKSMIQQAKAQFLTSKAAAQAQAKLQAEVEKKEVRT